MNRWAILLLCALGAVPAQAEISTWEWRQFMREDPKLYGLNSPSEEILAILKTHLHPGGYAVSVREISKRWAISIESADKAATAVVRREIEFGEGRKR